MELIDGRWAGLQNTIKLRVIKFLLLLDCVDNAISDGRPPLAEKNPLLNIL
jgi:hypothetical protein